MPDREAIEESHGKPLFTVLFWVGVGLAPLAALLLLIGQGNGSLRIAAVLAIAAVVLIGLSITLRGDADSVRVDLEETLLEEIDELRGDFRNDIATAVRATHKAFGEKLHTLHGEIEALRGQLEAVRGEPGRVESSRAGSARVEPARAEADWSDPPRAEAAHGAYRAEEPRGIDQHGPDRVRSGRAVVGSPAGQAPPPGRRLGAAASAVPPDQHDMAGGQYPAASSAGPPRGGRTPMPSGVVRHTETVQVTTRQTIVGPHEEDAQAGNVYGGGGYGGGVYGGHGAEQDDGWSPPAPRGRRSAAPDDSDDPGDDGYWADLRAGDRWASVRSDERGREIRMGERRAALHADGSGTELRVEDRWAAVRRDEPRRDAAPRDAAPRDEPRWAEPRGDGASRHGGHRAAEHWPEEDDRSAAHWDGRGSESEPEPAPRRRRGRDDDRWH